METHAKYPLHNFRANIKNFSPHKNPSFHRRTPRTETMAGLSFCGQTLWTFSGICRSPLWGRTPGAGSWERRRLRWRKRNSIITCKKYSGIIHANSKINSAWKLIKSNWNCNRYYENNACPSVVAPISFVQIGCQYMVISNVYHVRIVTVWSSIGSQTLSM